MFWHSVWHSFTYVLTVLGNLSGILSDIYSDILSNILSGIYSDTSVAHCIRGWREVSVGGENMKQIKLTMGKTMEKPWILRYFKDVLIMSSKVPKFQSADRWKNLPGCGVREQCPQYGAEGLRCFQAEGRAGQLWMSIFCWGLDWKGLGFCMDWLLVNFKDLTKPIRFRVGLYGCPSMISRRRCHWWCYLFLCPIYPPCSGAIGSNPGGMEFVDWLVV